MRGDGGLCKRKNSPFWVMYYNLRGKQYRESTGTTDERAARKILKQRLKEVGADQIGAKKFVGPKGERVTVGDLLDSLEVNYSNRGKLSPQFVSRLKAIRGAFGERRAIDVADEDVAHYIGELLKEGKANATINRYMQILGQAYKLGRKRVGDGPTIPYQPEDNVREGFFEHADFEAVVAHLAEDLQDFARWSYLCGWRKGEIASLPWSQFEMQTRLMHLSGRETKNGEPRKIALEGELWEIIERRWKARRIEMPSGETILAPLVFFRRHGRGVPGPWAPIREFRKSWKAACKAAGVPNKLFHDFRRTAARNLRRAGVSEEVAMLITGHKTVSVFRRYNITDERDLWEAMQKAQAYVRTLPTERPVLPLHKAESGPQ